MYVTLQRVVFSGVRFCLDNLTARFFSCSCYKTEPSSVHPIVKSIYLLEGVHVFPPPKSESSGVRFSLIKLSIRDALSLATLSATATHMLFTIAVSFATAFTPSGGLRAFTTRAPGRRRVVLLQTSKDMDEEISLAARVDERWKFLRDNPGMDAAEAADDAKANPMQRSKDKRLAERDTRQWCLDRCLATGYCEVRLPCPRRTWTRQGLPSGCLILGLVRLWLSPL